MSLVLELQGLSKKIGDRAIMDNSGRVNLQGICGVSVQ
jgi:hypothetical protein